MSKRVNGTVTYLIQTAITYVAGAELAVRVANNTYTVYYNNTLIGSTQTIPDSIFNINPKVGVGSSGVSNQFDDYNIYALGAEGQYNNLNKYDNSSLRVPLSFPLWTDPNSAQFMAALKEYFVSSSFTQETTLFGSQSGSGKWIGGVLAPDGCIYCVPFNSTQVLKISSATINMGYNAVLSRYLNKL